MAPRNFLRGALRVTDNRPHAGADTSCAAASLFVETRWQTYRQILDAGHADNLRAPVCLAKLCRTNPYSSQPPVYACMVPGRTSKLRARHRYA